MGCTKMCGKFLARGMCDDANCQVAHGWEGLQHRHVSIPAPRLAVGAQGMPIAVVVMVPNGWTAPSPLPLNRRQRQLTNEETACTFSPNDAMLQKHGVQWTM